MALPPTFLFVVTILLLRTTFAYSITCDPLHTTDKTALQEALSSLGVDHPVVNATAPCCYAELVWDAIDGASLPSARCLRVNGAARVVELGLNSYQLSGELPPSIGNLTALVLLALSYNSLTGPIPGSWGNLKNLSRLNLAGNKINGSVNVVAKMTELVYLDLGYNQFSGGMDEIPFEVLTALNYLDLSYNNFTGSFPSWIGPLSVLSHLYLQENPNMSPSELPSANSDWPELSEVLLSSMNLNGSIPKALISLSSLSTLDLRQNSLTGSIPNAFSDSIHFVYLRSNYLTGEIPASLAKPNIVELDLSNNFLNGSISEFLKTFCVNSSAMNYLYLSQNNLTGEIPSDLGAGNCSSFSKLALDNNFLNGTISDFSELKLEFLHLNNNNFSGELPTWSKGIAELNLANNQLTGNISTILSLQYMKNLNLSGNLFNGILPAETNWTGLNTIDLSRNVFSGAIPVTFVKEATSLREIDLSENNLSGDIPLTLFNSSELRSLNLRGNQLSNVRDPIGWLNISTYLKVLNFGNNYITEIPEWITNFTRLEEVYFDSNNIIGDIPPFLGNFSFLQVLDLSNNSFSSEIPDSFGAEGFVYDDSLEIYRYSSFYGLSSLNLSRCNLTGGISENIGKLRRLSLLDLSHNQLSGNITELHETSLVTLDLSDNNLSGELPERLAELPLKTLDLSMNKLTGYVPDSFFTHKLTNCSMYRYFPGNNLFAKCVQGLVVNYPRPPPPPSPTPPPEDKGVPIYTVPIAVVGSLLLFVLAALAAYYCIFKKKEDSITKNIQEHTVKFLPLQIINEATDNFSESNELGAGGFGIVYRGVSKNGEIWAVKRAKKASVESLELFKNEVETISRMNHKNLVKLIGFCHSDSEQILVYEFIENGTLKSALERREGSNQPVLTFEQRVDIALGAAEGLRYLHTQAKQTIIHRDVKSENIFLDANMQAKVGDFGLLKDNEDQEELAKRTAVAGTYGYMDPEYYTTYRVTTKSDVYSLGVVILELITGQPAIFDEITSTGDRERISLANWAMKMMRSTLGLSAIVDPSLDSNYSLDDMNVLASVAASCLQKISMYRPEMADVASHLRLLKTKIENRDMQVIENNGMIVLPSEEVVEEEGPIYPILRTTASSKSTSVNSRFLSNSSLFRPVPKGSVLLPR